MPTSTVRAGYSTPVNQQFPTRAYGMSSTLPLCARSGTTGWNKNAILWIKSPAPRGVTVTSATLYVYAKGSSSGSRTVSALRGTTGGWTNSNVTYNRMPATTAGGTVTVGTLADADTIAIDVTAIVSAWANGAALDGIVVTTTGTTTWNIYGYGSKHPPMLVVKWDDPPATPVHLVPSGGVVGIAAWTCQWAYSDMDGDALAAVRVQTSAAQNWAAPDFDSGTIAAVHPELDLTTTSFTPLSPGASTYWRCQVQDSGGAWSDWSDAVQVTYTPLGTITLTSPSPADPHVHALMAPVTWTYTGGTQAAWRVYVRNAAGATVADSGNQAGTTAEWLIPAGVVDDTGTYTVAVTARDNADRVSVPGAATWTTVKQPFTFAEVPAVTVPAGLVAAEVADIPAVVLSWTDTGSPDYFIVYRDGAVIEDGLAAGDVSTGTGTYAWTDHGARVGVTHSYALRGVLADQASALSATASVLLARAGIYLTDPATGRWFVVSGQDVSGWAMADNVATYAPLSSSQKVQVTQGQYGLAGTVTGVLLGRPGGTRTALDMETDLYAMKETPEATYRLVLGDINIPVKVSNLSVAPSADSSAQNIRRAASYTFFQCGEFRWSPRI